MPIFLNNNKDNGGAQNISRSVKEKSKHRQVNDTIESKGVVRLGEYDYRIQLANGWHTDP